MFQATATQENLVRFAPLCLALAACATMPAGAPTVTPPTGAAPVRTPTAVHASFSRTWNAVVDALAEQNIQIRVLDRSSGWVATEVLRVQTPPSQSRKWVDCGTMTTDTLATEPDTTGFHSTGHETVPNFPEQVEYDVVVHGDSAQATVHVAARWGSTYLGQWTSAVVECVTKGVWESEFENAVKRAAESTAR
jgi:uncharacterized lipoprotein